MPLKRKNSWSLKLMESTRKLLSILLVVFLVAFLLRLRPIAQIVAPLIGTEVDLLRDVAGYISGLSVGLIIVIIAVKILAGIPVIGFMLVAVGITFIIVEIMRLVQAVKQ